jgi:hypothetical protein
VPWHGVALLVFALALAVDFRGCAGRDPTRVAPLAAAPEGADATIRTWHTFSKNDLRFVVWVVARNAHAFLRQPTQLFEAETCHPARRALALGEPALTLGLLGAPFQALLAEPVATHNAALVCILLVTAFATYLLVREWTGQPLAGIAAGLLLAFHPERTANIVHPYLWDNGWTVLAILFAQRFAAGGRWRDALALAAATVLQLGGSLYTVLGSAALALPLLAWLLARHGVRNLRKAPCAVAAALVLLAALGLAAPFLENRTSGAVVSRTARIFIEWSDLLPGGSRFAGWPVLLLAAAGLALPGRGAGRGARLALVAGVLLAAWLAAGPSSGRFAPIDAPGPEGLRLPDLYGGLARVVPGMELVRVPAEIYHASLLATCLLAGLGAGALLSRLPPRAVPAAGAALVALAGAAALGPAWPGLPTPVKLVWVDLRPDDEKLALFEQLDELGNTGPLFEVFGLGRANPAQIVARADAVLLSAYHHRPTSACWSSFLSAEFRRVPDLAAALPARDALRELDGMGFTTIVLHHPGGRRGNRLARRLDRALAAAEESALRRLLVTPFASVYEIGLRRREAAAARAGASAASASAEAAARGSSGRTPASRATAR